MSGDGGGLGRANTAGAFLYVIRSLSMTGVALYSVRTTFLSPKQRYPRIPSNADYGEAAGVQERASVPKGSYVPTFCPLSFEATGKTQDKQQPTSGANGVGAPIAVRPSWESEERRQVTVVSCAFGTASDRLLVYFGWPAALEDAAGRALTAALEILIAIQTAFPSGPLGVRIGVATSEAVTRTAVTERVRSKLGAKS